MRIPQAGGLDETDLSAQWLHATDRMLPESRPNSTDVYLLKVNAGLLPRTLARLTFMQ